ncbi:MAG TPA: hypothetical protein PKD18_07540 [Saprospiraceae bacterium]|nr:hypothetical protein [Saprospiraceae bacterium]
MKKENINMDIADTVKSLLKMARDSSFNRISDNCSYIISEIKHSDKNFFEQTKIRKLYNDKKTPKSFADIIADLEKLYPDLYDVNLYVYKADKDSTIIEIQYFPRSSHDTEYQKISAGQETMLHCKVALPSYASEKKDKFDINWEHGTLNHKWKMFWWRRKTKKYLQSKGIKIQADT